MREIDKTLWPPTVHGRWMSEEYEAGLVSVIVPTYNRAHFFGGDSAEAHTARGRAVASGRWRDRRCRVATFAHPVASPSAAPPPPGRGRMAPEATRWAMIRGCRCSIGWTGA